MIFKIKGEYIKKNAQPEKINLKTYYLNYFRKAFKRIYPFYNYYYYFVFKSLLNTNLLINIIL